MLTPLDRFVRACRVLKVQSGTSACHGHPDLDRQDVLTRQFLSCRTLPVKLQIPDCLTIAWAFGQDRAIAARLVMIPAFLRQRRQVAPGQVPVDPLVDAANCWAAKA